MVQQGAATTVYSFPCVTPSGKMGKAFATQKKMVDTKRARGLAGVQQLAILAPMALEKPVALFKGVRDAGDECLCYVSNPADSYNEIGICAAPVGQVFLVFLNAESYLYHMIWDPADPRDSRLPVGYDTRFRVRVF